MTSSTKTKRERSRGQRWLDREGERFETRRDDGGLVVGDGGRGFSALPGERRAPAPTPTDTEACDE